METRREVLLPVSPETARRRLAAAFAAPLVVQRGSLFLAKIVCTGRIEGDDLWLQYVEQGRARVYIDLTGHLEEAPGGVRVTMTISSDSASHILVYLPLAALTLYFLLNSVKPGHTAGAVVPFLFLFLLVGLFTYLMRKLVSAFSSVRISAVERVLVNIITGTIPERAS
ncbi:hypothetical protein [Larkinella soli]|uniref:hypothetical protein n=1 Tax=Larkinella soli TaxID=1770527 RepID=UPI000FFC5AB8|nr:hypothetical protein [Larkinella soli]